MEGPQLRNCQNLSTSLISLVDSFYQPSYSMAGYNWKNFCHLWLVLAAEWHSCLVLCPVCLCVPLQPLLCVHTDTETRVHRDVRILTHTTQVTDIVSLPCANIFLSSWLFQCLRALDQARKSCMKPPKNIWHLPKKKHIPGYFSELNALCNFPTGT